MPEIMSRNQWKQKPLQRPPGGIHTSLHPHIAKFTQHTSLYAQQHSTNTLAGPEAYGTAAPTPGD
jgi:hypothetical protein